MNPELLDEWLQAKEAERAAQDRRREIEDQLASDIGLAEGDESAQTVDVPGYRIKVTPRVNRSVNADRLQEIAVENGLEGHIERLFRWKAELSMTAWRNTDASITAPLADAITAKPGRPSFSIERKENHDDVS